MFAQKRILWLPIKFLPFQQLQALWTLFSEFFSSFPHGTCSLSVSHHRYLASDGVYHLKLKFFKLHSQATWLVHKGSTGLRPRCLAIPSFIRFAYGSITLYSSFFQIKKRQVPFEFRKVKVVLRTWPFVYTTSLRSIPASANSRLGLVTLPFHSPLLRKSSLFSFPSTY